VENRNYLMIKYLMLNFSKVKGLVLCFFLLLATILAKGQVSVEERQALIDLYNSTDGDNWKNTLANDKPWLINDPLSPVSDWYGISISGGKVSRLSLGKNNLNGTLPATLGDLSGLRFLVLNGNNLSGNLIPEIFLIPNILNISIGGNKFSGSIPREIYLEY